MVIENLEEVEHVISEKPATFMITDAEIKTIYELLDASGGSIVYRAKIKKILGNVVHRTGM